MVKIKLQINGVHFAVHPNYNPQRGDISTEEMELLTIERLKELDEFRPEVILIPDFNNPKDSKAIQAWCNYNPIGYVHASQASEIYCLFNEKVDWVEAKIEKVEVRERGNFYVIAEFPDEVLLNKLLLPDQLNIWNKWNINIPELCQPKEWTTCRIIERTIEKNFLDSKKNDKKNLVEGIERWIYYSLHDFSAEAMNTRNNYIGKIRSIGDVALEPYAQELEKQIVAVCSDHRMKIRMDWWKELQKSSLMEQYWYRWRSSRKRDNLWEDLHTVDLYLRTMPNNLYSKIYDLWEFFSSLKYWNVPRKILWDIYTLLLLRERLCKELGIPMEPLPENAYGIIEMEESTKIQNTKKTTTCVKDKEMGFYGIVQYDDPLKLVNRLHKLIDGRKGADVGCVLLKSVQDGYLSRRPTQNEFKSEFILIGSWSAIHNYMNDNSEKALDRANKVIIF